MKILIAEDNITTRVLLKKLVEKMGFDCDLSEDGLEAWNKIEKKEYRMLITDWMMPGLNGADLCRKIRGADFKEYIYIILLTGKTEEGDIVDGLESGADDYIKKPFNKDELKARIRSGMRIIGLHDKNRKAQAHMLEVGKLVAIGNLAEGISHEINTPAQYIINNNNFLEDSFKDWLKAFEKFEILLNYAKKGAIPAKIMNEAEEALTEYDLDYLKDEIPKAINQNLSGLTQISKIVKSMKSFAKPNNIKTSVDLNSEIENTITVSTNEWKTVADIHFTPDYDLPLVMCYPGELNQVILDMIVNAAHAIKIKNQGKVKGKIDISTRKDKDICEITIRDDGCGIPKNIQSQIFDPFFSTKEVGKGTGQGLALANSVVTEMHNGSIIFETQLEKGTSFIIRIPII